MIRNLLFMVIVSVLVICTPMASSWANHLELRPLPLIPDDEWNQKTRTWLARAMVAEAGWDETADHVAIAYVLLRRWQLMRQSTPNFSMVLVIRKYCAGFRNVAFTKRQKWVKNLTSDAKRPADWPDDIHWRDYRERWIEVLNVAEAWRQGQYEDPCDGMSMYWGSPGDQPSKRMIKMDCGETKNRFYTTAPRLGN